VYLFNFNGWIDCFTVTTVATHLFIRYLSYRLSQVISLHIMPVLTMHGILCFSPVELELVVLGMFILDSHTR
jgi:hypothetical protein